MPGGVGHGQVAGEEVVEGGDVGRPLDAGVAPQGEDAAARPPDVAQEEWMMAAVRMYCTPTVCWVQPTA